MCLFLWEILIFPVSIFLKCFEWSQEILSIGQNWNMLGCTPHPPGLETLPHNLEEEGASELASSPVAWDDPSLPHFFRVRVRVTSSSLFLVDFPHFHQSPRFLS